MNLRGLFKLLYDRIRLLIAYIKEVFRNKHADNERSRVTSVFHGDQGFVSEFPTCIFAHYSSDQAISLNTREYLMALQQAGYNIILVSASEGINAQSIEDIRPVVSQIIVRNNLGYDFYSWKIGYDVYQQKKLRGKILFANDSVLVRKDRLVILLDKVKRSSSAYLGLTDCRVFGHHVQSYFWCISDELANSQLIHYLFRNMNVVEQKYVLIAKYEIGFSKKIMRRHKPEILYPLYLFDNGRKPIWRVNPVIDWWKELVQNTDFPFVKKEILTKRGIPSNELKGIL